MKYTLIHPSFDSPKGKTGELIEKLIELKKDGKNEGADEMLALAELFSREEEINFINYVPVQTGAVHKLVQEFISFLSSYKPNSKEIAKQIAERYAVKDLLIAACGIQSATSAIAASLMANNITSGEVITTSLNFLGVPNAIALAGATPKFADINPDDLCMDPASLEKTISKDTRAVVLVHFNQVVDIAPIDDVLKRKGLDIPVIQDASLAMGSTNNGMPAGIINLRKGGVTVYSFATSKIISGLGGAIVIANDFPLIERIQSIAYQGMNFANPEELSAFGANFKMNDMNAAIIMEQLKKRDVIFEKRRQLKSWYDRELADVVDSGKVSIQKVHPESIITHYGVLLPDRLEIAKKLAVKGIQLGLWHTAHLQPVYQKRFGTKAGTLPVTESIARRISFLPFHTKLTEEDVQFICKTLKEAL